MMIWLWRVGSIEIWFKVPWGIISKLSFLSSWHNVPL
jgi:hypothetical protein